LFYENGASLVGIELALSAVRLWGQKNIFAKIELASLTPGACSIKLCVAVIVAVA
jgi:hypothetical protein